MLLWSEAWCFSVNPEKKTPTSVHSGPVSRGCSLMGKDAVPLTLNMPPLEASWTGSTSVTRRKIQEGHFQNRAANLAE